MTAPTPIDQQEPGALEGAGVFSSWNDVGEAVGTGDAYQIVAASTGAALDTLGFVADPLGGLIQAGVGWAIEHFAFLREPLDMLAGDPLHIKTMTDSWYAVSQELGVLAAEVAATTDPTDPSSPPWEGRAADGYRAMAAVRAEAMAAVATQAEALGAVLLNAGAAIGTVRSLIRDLIAEFISWAVGKLVVAALAAAATGGPGALVVLGSLILDGIALAGRITQRIADLLRTLSDAGGVAGRLADAARVAAERTETGALYAYFGANVLEDLIYRYPVVERATMVGVEGAKQDSKAVAPEPAPPPP